MKKIGYAFIKDQMQLNVFDPSPTAIVSAKVYKVKMEESLLLVPSKVAPVSADPIEHLLFAIKYEGVNLQILSQALQQIEANSVLQALEKAPSGAYIRKLAFLWECFNRSELNFKSPATNYIDLFDSKKYVTTRGIKNQKWHVIFNGLGSLNYCPIVRRTQRIEEFLKGNILSEAQKFVDKIGYKIADRALQWAYLSETESSYAIEGETAAGDKALRFMKLLQKAHEPTQLSEDYLCDLQNQIVTNPFEQAYSFRNEQNWLSSGGRGALSVSYVPPPAHLLDELVPDYLAMANRLPLEINPIVAAAVTSFGFVFLHPFMDGNGRLSRFLFYEQLCRSGQLPKGTLLPVSVAMQNAEDSYLQTLQSFSKPARSFWRVTWLDEVNYDFKFNGCDSLYRYWDATDCVEFSFAMANDALNIYLKDEVLYLERSDAIEKKVNDHFDIRQNYLHHLINRCLDQKGVVSKNMRKKYSAMVSEELFDFLEKTTKDVLDNQ